MGTSKGYIPPKSPQWREAKGAITSMSKGTYDGDNAKKAISKYADAYMSTHLQKSNIANVAGGFLNFLQSISELGIEKAAENHGLSDLLDKSGNELYLGILDYFSRDIATIDGQVIRDSLFEALKELGIATFADLSNINNSEFLVTFLVEFAVYNFHECFSEKILSCQDNVNNYERILDNVESIISSKILSDVHVNSILQMDFLSKEGQAYIKSICEECFSCLVALKEVYV